MRSKQQASARGPLTKSALAVTLVALAVSGCGGGGGGSGGNNSGDTTRINSSLNDSISSTFASIGGFEIPGDATVDNTIELDPPTSGPLPLTPGMVFQTQVGFTAPAGVNVTGVGVRFGSSGPINVLPLAALSFHRRSESSFAQQLARRAKLDGFRTPSPLHATFGLDQGFWSPSHAGTGSDSCESIATADQISGTGSFPASTVGATDGTVNPPCGSTNAFRDIWFRWTAEISGATTFSTTGAPDPHMDSVLSIWPDSTGCPNPGTAITCNDNYQGSNLESQVSLVVSQGTSYLIQISNFDPDQSLIPAWSGALTIAAGSGSGGGSGGGGSGGGGSGGGGSGGGGSGGGGSGGTGSITFLVPSDICDRISSICHQVQLYAFAVTDEGTVSRANITDIAMKCGACEEPSCQQLIPECQDEPEGTRWFGSWNGTCGGKCEESEGGTFAIYVDPNGGVVGVAVDPGGVSTVVSGSFDSAGNVAFGSAGGSSWVGSISGTGESARLTGTYTDDSDPSCPSAARFPAPRTAAPSPSRATTPAPGMERACAARPIAVVGTSPSVEKAGFRDRTRAIRVPVPLCSQS